MEIERDIAPRSASGIEPPGRASGPGAALVLAAVALQAAGLFLPRAAVPWVAGGLGALALAGLLARQVAAVHAGLFLALLTAVVPLNALQPWPLPLVVALVAYLNVALLSPSLRAMPTWLRFGRPDRTAWLLVAATVAVSAGALLAWNAIARPDLAPFLAHVPRVPTWALPLVGLGFAAVNAAAEEAAYRGVLMQALDAALGPGTLSVLVQAVAFGALHRRGFPGGASGMVLAGIYGLALGAIRRRSRGMLAPWIAHVAADAVIFGIVVALAR